MCHAACNVLKLTCASGVCRKNAEKAYGYWLALLAEESLSGTVESMSVLKCRASGRQRDAVMLASRRGQASDGPLLCSNHAKKVAHIYPTISVFLCRCAKISVLDWDAETHSVTTTSLHSFESNRTKLGGQIVSSHALKIVTDPQVCSDAIRGENYSAKLLIGVT